MSRYVGLRCRDEQCKTFMIWKELQAGDPPVKVKVTDIVSGTCPKCGRGFTILAEQMEEIESDSIPKNTEVRL